MLKVGVIGTGFIGMQHIEAIRRIPGCRIVSITGRDIKKLNEYRDLGLCDRVYTDYKEMIKYEKLDVIHNCTPTNLHFEINKLALENDINVFGEKPLVRTLDEAKELVDLASNRNIATAVNFNYRNNLLVQEMRSRIENQDFGRVLFLQGEYLQDWLMYQSDYDWRVDVDSGGESRALSDIGSHLIDIMQYVTNSKVKAVNSKLFTVHNTRFKNESKKTFEGNRNKTILDEVKVKNEDGGIIQALFDNGVLASFVVSQVSAGKKNGLKLFVSGEHYSLEWNQEQSDRLIIGNRDKGNEEIFADGKYVSEKVQHFASLPNGHPVGWHDALTNGIRMFYKDINQSNINGIHTYATFKDGYNIMQIIDACLRSDKEERWINLQED